MKNDNKKFDITKKLVTKSLAKPKSYYTIAFQISEYDIGDDWFIDIITYKTKSLEITNKTTITKKDLNTYLKYMKDRGYLEIY